jgi:negative regulator of flagellin synthesis FlgM
MKINPLGSQGINPYKRQMNKLDQANKTSSKAADKVEISSAAKEMQQESQISNERDAKVNELKIQVENGTYKVDPKAVAKSIVNFYKK